MSNPTEFIMHNSCYCVCHQRGVLPADNYVFCHHCKPTPNTWEERFEKQFLWRYPNKWNTPKDDGGELPMQPIQIKSFIRRERALAKQEGLYVGHLRQWLNEDRITNPNKMVTDNEIEFMLGLTKKLDTKKEL